MMSANVTANIKQQEIKDTCIFIFFFKEVPSKLEIQCKRGCIFYLIFVGISSILILFVNNRCGWGGGWKGGGFICLMDKTFRYVQAGVACSWLLSSSNDQC